LFILKCGQTSFKLTLLAKSLPRYALSIIIVVALGVVLFGNLRQVVIDQTFRSQTYEIVQAQIKDFPGAFLEDVRYETIPHTLIVRAVIHGPDEFTPLQVAGIAAKLPAPPNGLTMDFRLRFVKTTVITPDGYLYNDSAGTIK
jgi:hypothetical protein